MKQQLSSVTYGGSALRILQIPRLLPSFFQRAVMRDLAIFSLFLGCVVSVPLSVNVGSNVQYPGVDYSQSVEVYPKNSSFICEDNYGEKVFFYLIL